MNFLEKISVIKKCLTRLMIFISLQASSKFFKKKKNLNLISVPLVSEVIIYFN